MNFYKINGFIAYNGDLNEGQIAKLLYKTLSSVGLSFNGTVDFMPDEEEVFKMMEELIDKTAEIGPQDTHLYDGKNYRKPDKNGSSDNRKNQP